MSSNKDQQAQGSKPKQNRVDSATKPQHDGAATLLAESTFLPLGNSVDSQVAMLKRLYPAQQQTMIQKMSSTQGNRHVQRVVTAMRQSSAAADAPAVMRAAQPSPSRAPIIQAKLTVNAPDDQFEREADAVADTVMRMPANATPPPPDDPKGQARPAIQTLRVQRAAQLDNGGEVSGDVESRVAGLRGGGAPLPTSERSFFEDRFGQDFSSVRLHTNHEAAQLSQDLSARAFTVGNDIAFNAGEYQPGSSEGRKLLAHELTHTVQQTGGVAAKRVQREESEVPAEAEAQVEEAPTLSPEEAVKQAEALVTPADAEKQKVEAIEATEVALSEDETQEEGSGGGGGAAAADGGGAAAAPDKGKSTVAPPAPPAADAKASPAPATTPATAAAATPPVAATTTDSATAASTVPTTPVATTTTESATATPPVATPDAASSEKASTPAPTDQQLRPTTADNAAPDAQPATTTDNATDSKQADAKTDAATSAEQAAKQAAPAQELSSSEEEGATIQRKAGGVRIQRLAQDGAGGGVAPKSAEADPAFKAVEQGVKGAATQEKTHKPAKSEADAAQAAAKQPTVEVEGHAQNTQVGQMGQAPTPGFDAAGFKAKLMERIASTAPKTLEEADNFKNNNQLGQVKQEVQGTVTQEEDKTKKPMEEATKATPDTGSVPRKDVTALQKPEAGGTATVPGAEGATPKSKGSSEVEAPIQSEPKKVDEQMAEAQITEEQLEKSNEPQFTGALKEKRAAEDSAEKSPTQYRQFEQGQLQKAQTQAVADAALGTKGMHGARETLLGQVGGKQDGAKSEDEKRREKVGTDIRAIYSKTKDTVTQKLDQLDSKVTQLFDAGAARAKQAFEDYVDRRMSAYKEERYSGIIGKGKWLKDKLLGMPSAVNAFYVEGRQLYISEMDKAIDDVVKVIGQGLTDAKSEIAKGKKEIEEYVKRLPEDLREVGQQAAQDIQSEFDALTQQVDSKQNELIDTLAQKYNENLQAIDARIEELKAANQGLVQKAFDAIGGVIKTILELKEMLLGVLSRAAGAVTKILKDPIGFLGNLISGVKQGLMNFVGNIGTHLQAGLMGWLTGTIASSGLKMPAQLDLPGIFSIVMQVLGLTWENIRAQIVRGLGPQGEAIVGALEKAWEVFQIIQTQGLAGLWKYMQDMVGDLKTMVIEEIKSMVTNEVIKAGIQWLIGILGGPAGAFIKAAQAIIKVVMWFINNGSRLMALVNSVIDSVSAIADGNIGGAAAAIERSLAQALPMAISFLADLIGLGGIATKVQGIIKKVKAPIDRGIQWLIKQAKAMAAKLKGLLGGKDQKPDDKAQDGLATERTMEQKQADLDKGLKEADLLLSDDSIPLEEVNKRLPAIKAKYQMQSLELVVSDAGGGKQAAKVEGVVNPSGSTPTHYKNLQELCDKEMPEGYKNKYYGPEHFSPTGSFPNGLRFDAQGFPDFTDSALKVVTITMHGDHSYKEPDGDFWQANIAAGYAGNTRHPNHTWHHHQDRKTMLLVPKAIHAKSHRGGVWVIKYLGKL